MTMSDFICLHVEGYSNGIYFGNGANKPYIYTGFILLGYDKVFTFMPKIEY